ncbi:MAG: MoxR family ATPase [Gammaproteobacteria bacterium]|jgi:MoxR-like ATPase
MLEQSAPDRSATDALDRLIDQATQIILGKEDVIRLALACLMARGHLLIEDLPGVGKTTLAHALARALGLSFQRIQFTSDLLPADILGVSVYNQQTATFTFHPGPIFSHVILADEVNRATPRSQSALLEAMEEDQVTLEGETRPLPKPFFIIATQNPSHLIGTFPLPESQLDRFLMRLELGYPDAAAERELLKGRDRRDILADMGPVIDAERLLSIQQEVTQVHVASALLDYLQDLLEFSRQSPYYLNGLSPRAGLAILRAAQAWALMHGHAEVLPEDVQAVLPSVIGHRLRPTQGESDYSPTRLASDFIAQVPIP